MKSLNNYIDEYSMSHQNKMNILIHKFCVPAILFSSMGILKALPVPVSWPLWLDWCTIQVLLCLVFYISFRNFRMVVAMIVMITPMWIILELLRPRFFILSLALFIVAWLGQFIGHKIEGKKPSFFQDLFFLLIGPIWTMNILMARIGIDLKINNAKDIY